MGKISKKIRHNLIPGPNKPSFNRKKWEELFKIPDIDSDDKRIISAGVFFDDLLQYLRSEIKLSELSIKPSAISRIIIAISTCNLKNISQKSNLTKPKKGERTSLVVPSLLQETVSTLSGQLYSPDELITGSGDGMKHVLRQLYSTPENNDLLSEYEIIKDHVVEINTELNKAIIYQCAVEYWNDCVGNSYGLTKHQNGIALAPYDKECEISRVVSIYRRLNIAMQDSMFILDKWFNEWPRHVKEKMCEIPLATKIYGTERITRIELGLNKKVLDSTSPSIAAKLWIKNGYYENLLDEQLPKLNGFTINQIIDGWRLLQSIASAIFDELGQLDENNINSLLQFAPRISHKLLCAVFSKALKLDINNAEKLINVFVYTADNSQEIWTQPLVSCNDDYCLVIPCIHSVHLQRIVEGWMRQGGLDLDRKGPEFEKFCRDDLNLNIKDSPIKNHIILVNQAVKFKPHGERPEEIDIVIIVADTILLIEAKCILWPDDSLQFANYRETVEKAVIQICRKRDSVQRNYRSFVDRLKQLGYSSPEAANVICCVLTNSAVFSGFPIDGVPIVDLSILGKFFENEHIKYEVRQKGITLQRHSIKFYEDANEAGKFLEGYLLNPPQLSDARNNVKTREIIFPVESPDFGKLLHLTFRVEMDVQEMMATYDRITPA